MLSRTDAQQGANSLEVYIKKIHSVFEMHRVPFGAPEDLPVFLKKLREDRHLAMDFWALTAAISKNEGDDLPNDQMVEIIVRGATGKDAAEVSESGRETKQAVDHLSRLLAGEDVDNPLAEPEEPWPPSPAEEPAVDVISRIRSVEPAIEEPVIEKVSAEKPKISVEKPVVEETLFEKQAASSTPEEDKVPIGQPWEEAEVDLIDDLPSSASPTLSKRALDEALLQLELNSRQLKLHLNDIDSRMSRLEPHLRELASKAPSRWDGGSVPTEEKEPVPVTHLADEQKLLYEPVLRPSRRSAKNPRLVLLADPRDDEDDPSIPIPLEGYGQRRASRSAVLFAAILLVAGAVFLLPRLPQQYGGSLWQQWQQQEPLLRETLRQKYDAFSAELQALISGRSRAEARGTTSTGEGGVDPMSSTTPASAVAIGGTPARGSAHEAPQNHEAQQNQPASHDATPAETPPAPAPAQQGATTAPREAAAAPSPAGPATPSTIPRNDVLSRHHRRMPVEIPQSTRVSRGITPYEPPVNVPPAVMQANLITSRVPAYPEAAKADGVEGPVVMQAIISKDGIVDQVYVLKGDPLLRNAASEAVFKWRYRPYILNGRPVEVATTVRIDFRLPNR